MTTSPFREMEDFSPTTLEEAVQALYDWMGTDAFRQDAANLGCSALHGGLGMRVRNKWGLWMPSSVLGNHFRNTYGLGHADDMSGLIIEGLYAKLTGKPLNVESLVDQYKDHWARAGVDPLTCKKIS